MRLLRVASSKGSLQSAMGMAWTWGEEGVSLAWGCMEVVIFGLCCKSNKTFYHRHAFKTHSAP